MISPQEKAYQIKERFHSALTSKECALGAVDEILDAIDWHKFEVPNDQIEYWLEVQKEIEKL